ncbi:MAG: AAA family ATPase [Bacteroidaceae bacterium]|nr:AAA family ATPase [Bacteroidaceae bacterium]
MVTSKNIDLLTAVEQIVDLAKESKLSKEFYRKADKYIKYISEKLELTKEQSVMIALFINWSDESCIHLKDISEYVKCPVVCILRYTDILESRELIRCRRKRNERVSFRVPFDVVEAFKHDEKYVPRRCTNLTCLELFAELENIFEERDNNELTFDTMASKIQSLFADNPQIEYVQKVKDYDLDTDVEMLLVLFSHLFVNKEDDDIRYYQLDFLYDNKRDWSNIRGKLSRGHHKLFWYNLIEYNNDNGMVDRDSFRMTQKAKDEFFGELSITNRSRKNKLEDLIKSEEIVEKKLYYGDNIRSQINELSQLIEDTHYKEIHTRMKESGFRCGFTCLFYGAPGTGKTETVLQLGRQTGRDIIQVNLSQIKSCWVGESEKNIKNLFDVYRNKVRKSKLVPILLFNEADAIINQRMEGAQTAANKMENSIQNIILQEMENFDGILIATTNLAGNMDKAFERRFLYKIKFEKPTLEARMSIWHEMIPTLDDSVTRTLATKYDFSGGQIENIARHYTIGNILHGKLDNDIDIITSYCDNERLDTRESRKIGF